MLICSFIPVGSCVLSLTCIPTSLVRSSLSHRDARITNMSNHKTTN